MTSKRRSGFLCAVCAAVLSSPASFGGSKSETVSLTPTADSWIQDESGASRDENLGSLELLAIGGRWEGTRFRGLMRFDFSSIPEGASIASASLGLFHTINAVEGENVNTIGVYGVLQDWVESEVTWNSFAAGAPWEFPGAGVVGTDRDDVLLSSHTFDATSPVEEYYDFDVTLGVKEAVEGERPDYGFLFTGLEEGPLEERYFSAFFARESDASPPVLEVTYAFETFRRGDANVDGTIDLSDAIQTLGYLFLGESEPPCLDAADVDDSGSLEITDAVRLLDHLFSGGNPPSAPYTECDTDPTADGLGCASFDSCP